VIFVLLTAGGWPPRLGSNLEATSATAHVGYATIPVAASGPAVGDRGDGDG